MKYLLIGLLLSFSVQAADCKSQDVVELKLELVSLLIGQSFSKMDKDTELSDKLEKEIQVIRQELKELNCEPRV